MHRNWPQIVFILLSFAIIGGFLLEGGRHEREEARKLGYEQCPNYFHLYYTGRMTIERLASLCDYEAQARKGKDEKNPRPASP